MTTELTLLSWNVNGLRAAVRKGFLTWFQQAAPDVLCLQETRVEEALLPAEIARLTGYDAYWHAAQTRKGYSGTGLLTRIRPLEVQTGLGIPEFDQEGRTQIARYATFTLLNGYFPNGRRDQQRVDFKMAFYEAFLERCEALRRAGQAVIFCGDVNTAHRPIDLTHPGPNRNTSGFLPEERAWMDRFIEAGYVDTFRHFHPDAAEQYTWWSQATRARERNVGWRIDYFFVAAEVLPRVRDAFILPEVMGSDHCPVGIVLEV